MVFYTVGKRGTVTRQRFNCRGACKRLYEGMKGIGTNEDAITEVIAGHTVAQRQEIKTKYKIMYGKDLLKELDGELSGVFGKLVLSLMKDPEEFILETLRNAIVKSRGDKLIKKLQQMTYKKGLCSDAYTLLGLLLLRSNQELEEMKKAYKKTYDTELEDDVGKDFADEFRSLIFGIIYAGRDESAEVDLELLQEDIEIIHNGGEGTTKEEHFQACFEERSWVHLRKLYNSYQEVTGESLEEQVLEKSEIFSELIKEAYATVVKILRSEPDFYAERLREAIAGLGTDDDTLCGIIVLRSEIDLVDIMMRYEVIFGTTLEEDVIGDTSGDYKNILLKLLTVPDGEEEEEEERKWVRVRRVPGVEVGTQTEEEEKPHNPVNAADHDGLEAIGHEVDLHLPVEEKVEEVVLAEVEEEVVVEEKVETIDATEAVDAEEEAPVVEDVIEVEQKEETGEEVVAEEETGDNTIVEEEACSPPPPPESITQEEEEEKKKAEDVDNAEGG